MTGGRFLHNGFVQYLAQDKDIALCFLQGNFTMFMPQKSSFLRMDKLGVLWIFRIATEDKVQARG